MYSLFGSKKGKLLNEKAFIAWILKYTFLFALLLFALFKLASKKSVIVIRVN